MLLQHKKFCVSNRMRVASAVRETQEVKVGVSSRVDRALCLTSVKDFSLQQNQVSAGLLVMEICAHLSRCLLLKSIICYWIV